MPRPAGTFTRPGPPSCTSSRPQTVTSDATRVGGVCDRTVYTVEDDDVVDDEGPALRFYRRLNSMYFPLVY